MTRRITMAAMVMGMVSSTARADPLPCKAEGSVVIEVDQGAARGAKLATAVTTLYDSGFWTTAVTDREGQPARTATGCVKRESVDHLRDELRDAKWQVLRRGPMCRADAPRFTTFKWKTRPVYTERACDHIVLDRASQQALDDVEVTLHLDDPDDARHRCSDSPLGPGCP